MHSSGHDLIIFQKLGVKASSSKAQRIIPMRYSLLDPYWIKVNTNRETLGCPCLAGGGGIFRSS